MYCIGILSNSRIRTVIFNCFPLLIWLGYRKKLIFLYYLYEHLKLHLYCFPIDVRPLIQTADEENYATVVGYSAFLHCEFFASPEAIVSW